jgi:amino-acid N-acetyltransferase
VLLKPEGPGRAVPDPGAASRVDVRAVRAATDADLAAILALLTDSGLPVEGASGAFGHGIIAVADGTGVVAGGAAVERYGSDGLLRSVVVAPQARGLGTGRALVTAAEAMARDLGIRDLYLLTETAESWFARLGYTPLDRAAAPAGIADTWEFRYACVERGVLMHRSLED